MYKAPLKSPFLQKKPAPKVFDLETETKKFFKSLSDEFAAFKEQVNHNITEKIAEHTQAIEATNELVESMGSTIDAAQTELNRAQEIQRGEDGESIQGEKGDPGETPIAGIHFPIPENGRNANPEDVVPLVLPLVLKKLPKVKDGKNGKDGINTDPETVVELIKEKKLIKAEHIDGLEQTAESLFDRIDRRRGRPYLHGGGDTVKAGTNVTLTRNNDGTVTISATGSSVTSVYNEIVGGSGTTFTLAFVPTVGSQMLYIRGQRITPGLTTYSILGKVITTIDTLAAGDVVADYTY